MTTEQRISDVFRTVAVQLENALEEGRRSSRIDAHDLLETLLAVADRLDPPLAENAERRPSLVEAARALLEAQEDQMVTQVHWDQLRAAVDAAERGR